MQAPSVDRFGEQFAEAQAGDNAAMLELVDDFFDPLTAFFERRGAHDPESSANDAIERAIRHGDPERIDSSPAFRAFLYAIARNQAKNEFRTRERRPVIDLVEEPARLPWRTAPSAESVVFDEIAAEDLLAQVKPDQAEVLELRFLDGYTVKETAALVGKSVPAVNALQRRGLTRLRQVVGTVLAVVLVWVGVRVVLAPPQTAPVISEDHPSEIGELPTENEDVLEDGAPVIVDVEGVTEVITETTEPTPEPVVDDRDRSVTLQSQLLDALENGQFNARFITTTTSLVAPTTSLVGRNTLPVAAPTTAPVIGPAEPNPQTPGNPAIGQTGDLPTDMPDPVIRQPETPRNAVAPEVIIEVTIAGAPTSVLPAPEQPEAGTTTVSSTSTSSTTSTTTSLVPPVDTGAPAAAPEATTSTSILPDGLTDPIGDAFGAVKSLVSEPLSWFEDTNDAIDITN